MLETAKTSFWGELCDLQELVSLFIGCTLTIYRALIAYRTKFFTTSSCYSLYSGRQVTYMAGFELHIATKSKIK